MATTMKQAITAIKNYMDSKGFKYQFDEANNIFTLTFSLSKTKLGRTDIRILVRPTTSDPNVCHRLVSYGQISLHADNDCMAQVAEYLHRANYGLNLGNFELDVRDGEIRYKVSMNVRDAMVGQDAIDDMLALPVSMFNKYGNGLLAVTMGMMSPEDALKKAEE